MGTKEKIQVNTAELAVGIGKLDSLHNEWDRATSVLSKRNYGTISAAFFNESRGKSVERLKEGIRQMQQLTAAYSTLIEDTTRYFSSMDASFKKADRSASEKIDTLTK